MNALVAMTSIARSSLSSLSALGAGSARRRYATAVASSARTPRVVGKHTRRTANGACRHKAALPGRPVVVSRKSTAARSSPITSSAESSPPSSSSSFMYRQRGLVFQKDDTIDIAALAKQVGVRLTKDEVSLLRQKLDHNKNGVVSEAEFCKAGLRALEDRWARELCLSVICQPKTALDRLGAKLHSLLDYGGTALFAVVGTQIAGDAGMNIIGCSLVGCAAAMGGGTLNNFLYGISSPLLGQQGVFWVKDPTKLMLSLAASVITFFAWPEYCRWQAEKELRDVIGEENLEPDGASVREAAFVAACERDEEFAEGIRAGLKVDPDTDPHELFQLVDTDGSGDIDVKEMQTIVGKRFDGSPTVYMLDTAALSALSVVGVRQAVGQGLHPFIAATSGVTICFGGILRDVLSSRDLAIGGQSFALATGAGSAVYVALRELHLRRIMAMPLVGRIFLSAGTVAIIRMLEFERGEPLLSPMHGDVKVERSTIHANTVSSGKKATMKVDDSTSSRKLWANPFNNETNTEASEIDRSPGQPHALASAP